MGAGEVLGRWVSVEIGVGLVTQIIELKQSVFGILCLQRGKLRGNLKSKARETSRRNEALFNGRFLELRRTILLCQVFREREV